MPDRHNIPESAPDIQAPASRTTRSFLHQLQELIRARSELLGLETKEATLVLTRKAILVIATVVSAVLSYLLLLTGVGWILNFYLSKITPNWSVPTSAFLLALFHLGVALLFGRLAKRKSGPPLFEHTRSEWQKDCTWLSNQTSRNENEN